MAIEYPDLNSLNSDDVQKTLDFITQRMAEFAPTIESKRSVFRDIVLYLSSVLGNGHSKIIEDEIRKSNSLVIINESPSEADEDIVDKLISNFRISRNKGTTSTGTATIVIDSFTPVTITKGTIFETNGLFFEADNTYRGRIAESNVVNETDRLIKQSGSEYIFSINLISSEIGTASNIKRLTKLSPQITISNFIRAYAETDFSGGTDADTNETLIKKLPSGMASKNLSNRSTIEAVIKSNDTFKNLVNLSITGYGDEEQIRYHSIFPVAFGGRLDVYARTSELPNSKKITKTCTLIEKTANGGIWQFSINRNDFPGFYEVSKIILEGIDETTTSSYEITEDIRGIDTTSDSGKFIPDVITSEEGAFSKYQTATIRFLDTDTNVSSLTVNTSTQDYDVIVIAMPNLEELQDYLGNNNVRNRAGDVLVKAPVPAFLSLSFTIQKALSESDPDTDTIKTNLANYVNNLGFTGKLYASSLSHTIHNSLIGIQTMNSMDMFARILYPNGQTNYIRSGSLLEIPKEAAKMVSSKTTLFILDPDDIFITIETLST